MNLLPLARRQAVLDLAGGEAEAQDLLPEDEAMLVSEQLGLQVTDRPRGQKRGTAGEREGG